MVGDVQVLTLKQEFGSDANAQDPVLNSIEWEPRRQTLIAKREERDGEVVYRFDIYIQGDKETVFLDI